MKIKRIKSIGKQCVYSPEMASEQHNYITGQSNAIHRNSHAVSYCLVAYKCLWLKAHFAPEWWSAVMSDCHSDKLVRYMGIARSEKWKPTSITYSGKIKPKKKSTCLKFDILNISNMTPRFTVTGDIVNQGLIGIKGIGDTAANKYKGVGEFTDIDDFIEQKGGKDKSSLERFIKLGAFKHLPGHKNNKAVWTWYQYKYCSSVEITKMRTIIREMLLKLEGWNEKTITIERKRMIDEYRKQFPNRKKIPDKFQKWQPKADDRREKVMSLIVDDFSLNELLEFEKLYLGYYLHSPLDLYMCSGDSSIEDAKAASKKNKKNIAKLEVVIVDIDFGVTKNKKDYARIIVDDGTQQILVMMWHNEMGMQNANNLKPGTGVQMYVDYDEQRNTFVLARNEIILRLKRRE